MGGLFYEMEGCETESDEDGVADPGVEAGQAERGEDAGLVEEIP